jgi:CHAT domain-containing protein
VNVRAKLPGPGIASLIFGLISSLYLAAWQTRAKGNPGDSLKQYRQEIQAGEAQWREGNFEAAFARLTSALELAREMKDGAKEVRCAMGLGRLCWALGRPDDSRKCYSDILAAAENSGLKKEGEESQAALKILDLYNQAKADRFASRREESIRKLNAAAELARQIDSREHEARCLRQLSLVHLDAQELESFFSLSEKVLGIARELRDRGLEAKCLINIGHYHLKLKEYSRALDCYSEAMEISRTIGSKEDESVCLKNMSVILTQIGVYDRSLDYLLAARAIDKEQGNTYFLSQNLINIGAAYRNRGLILANTDDLYQALQYFTEALDIAKSKEGRNTQLISTNNIGNIHLILENYEAALLFLKRARQYAESLGDREAMIEILTNTGICQLKLGNDEEARQFFQAALAWGERVGTDRVLWEPWFYLGQCRQKENQPEQALACYENSIAAIDNIRGQILPDFYKVKFGRDKLKVYESLVSLLLELSGNEVGGDRAEDIFSVVEKAKARSFLEGLGEAQHDVRGRLNVPLKKKEAEISSRLYSILKEMSQDNLTGTRRAALQSGLRQSEDEYLRLVARLRAEAPEVADILSPLPVGVEQVQGRILDEKTAILEYFLGDSLSLLFLLTKTGISVFPLPPRGKVEQSIQAYIKLLSDPPRGMWKGAPAAARLYHELLEPALFVLPEPVERLVIVPDGLLCYLPFETLALSQAGDSPEGNLLVSKFAISYAPSCSSLLFLKEKKRSDVHRKALLAFGDPLYPGPGSLSAKNGISMARILKETYEGQGFDFSSLAQSTKEVREISRLFAEKDRDVYLGKDASEEAIKKAPLEDYGIIHFACHSFLDEKLPFRSALVLSQEVGEKEDGFLQAREIAALHMSPGMVVLSACQTGRGSIERGEGILGLTRIFFCAGARSVVSTLWEIGDEATAEFMSRFYHYLSRKMDEARALQLAKLSLLDTKYAHPFYWAAFVLHGEASSPVEMH